MSSLLEWSNSCTGRLTNEMVKANHVQGSALAKKLAAELEILPFLSMTYRSKLELQIEEVLPKIKKFKHMLILGIGGSALGTRALQQAFAPEQNWPNHTGPCVWIADNVCAQTFEAWLSLLNAQETVVVIISKSGGTIETISQYFLVSAWLEKKLGAGFNEHVVAITDANNGFLRQEVKQKNFLSLEVPDNLGGRYSALSAVSMLPAAFMGIDWKNLMNGAASVASLLVNNPENLKNHPSFALAAWCKALEDAQYSQLILFSYIPLWATFGAWFSQLWAESLGKQGKGTMPISATGVTDQHSIQQMFLDGPRNKGCLFLSCSNLPQGRIFPETLPDNWAYLRNVPFGSLLDAEALGTQMALSQTKTPLVNIQMQGTSPFDAGAFMMLLESATVFTGWLMNINPLDQPAVESGKRLANAKLGASGYEAETADLNLFLSAQKQEQTF